MHLLLVLLLLQQEHLILSMSLVLLLRKNLLLEHILEHRINLVLRKLLRILTIHVCILSLDVSVIFLFFNLDNRLFSILIVMIVWWIGIFVIAVLESGHPMTECILINGCQSLETSRVFTLLECSSMA